MQARVISIVSEMARIGLFFAAAGALAVGLLGVR
jgi:hypothetical protein